MELIIIQQGPGLSHEFTHGFLDSRLRRSDYEALSSIVSYVEQLGRIKIFLPCNNLDRSACTDMRHCVSGLFVNGRWVDLYKAEEEKFKSLNEQQRAILPYIPNFTYKEIADIFKGRYTASTVKTYITKIYGILVRHSQPELLEYLYSAGIPPVSRSSVTIR
jgi:hypothetical protein